MLIYSVTQVYVVQNEDPKKLTIHAAGLTATTGWTNPRLVPVEVSVPERPLDPAVLQFNFEADRPKGISLPVLTPIQASLEITPEGPVDAVTVHAHTNSVTVHVSSFAAPAAVSAAARGAQAIGQAPTAQIAGAEYDPTNTGPTAPIPPGEHAYAYTNPVYERTTTFAVGEQYTTLVVGEEHLTTLAVGEEVTTFIVGEEGPGPFGCI